MIEKRLVSIAPDGKIAIDLGCGEGSLLDQIQSYENLIGIDLNLKKIQNKTHLAKGWSFVCSNLNLCFPIQSNSVDTIFSNQVVEHIDDPEFFASEIFLTFV